VVTIRKVDLTMDENKKYIIIKTLVETNGNKKRAALELNCTSRHINRMMQGYKQQGKAYFVHGNHNRKPSHTIDIKKKNLILDLYTSKYSDSNFTHFTELLEKHENIKISTSTINSILKQEFILSPKAKENC
jgi:transposase